MKSNLKFPSRRSLMYYCQLTFLAIFVVGNFMLFSSNNPLLKRVLSEKCTQQFEVRISSQADTDLILSINNNDEIKSPFKPVDNYHDTHWDARRTFSFSLDESKVTGSFIRSNIYHWPVFVEVVAKNSTCNNTLKILAPPIEIEKCRRMIRNGKFEYGNVTSSGWYHNGPGIKLVDGGVSGRALSTDFRRKPWGALVHFLDTRCFALGYHYKITAMVKLVSRDNPNNETSTCDPKTLAGMGGDRCPRGNLKYSSGGSESSYMYDIGFTTEYHPGEWNPLWGYFVVNEELASADNVAFFIEGPRPEFNILIDDVNIFQFSTIDYCVPNDDFEKFGTKYWYCKGTSDCYLSVISPGYNNKRFAITARNRESSRWGLGFDIEEACFDPTKKYEVSAYFKFDGLEVDCNPFIYWHDMDESCPYITITNENSDKKRDILAARTVGPIKKDNWNRMYGILDGKEVSAFLAKPGGFAFVGSIREDVSIIIDNVSIEEADSTKTGDCSQLIKNGDAEIGDARFWYIKENKNSETIDIVSPGAGESQFAFSHAGTRTHPNQGLWQEIDKSCMSINSKWKISAKFKISYECDETSLYSLNACPRFGFHSGGGMINDRVLMNENDATWDNSIWNQYDAVFKVNSLLKAFDRIFIFAIVPQGKTYSVDDISVTPVKFTATN